MQAWKPSVRTMHLLLAGLIGAAFLSMSVPADFITGSSAYWASPGLDGIDSTAAIVGLRYFLADAWRFPLMAVPHLGSPGTTAVYTDSVPLVAIALKLAGVRDFNPFGWIVAASYVLTPVSAVLAVRAAGLRTTQGAITVATFTATLPTFTLRVTQVSLMAQFFILAAITCLLLRGRGRPCLWGEAALPPLALSVHPYLMAFTLPPLAAGAVLGAWRAGPARQRARSFCPLALGLVMADLLAFALGVRAPPASLEREWGNYATNLLSPFWPRFSSLFSFPDDGGALASQADGRLWLGFGAVVLLVTGALATPVPGSRRNGRTALWACSLACLAYAVTTRPSIGPLRFGDAYPEALAPLLEAFRASGRFAWVAAWTGVTCACSRIGNLERGGTLLLCLAAFQAWDTAPARRESWRLVSESRPLALTDPGIAAAFGAAARIDIYPPYDCVTTPVAHDITLEAMALASLTRTPISSARTARRPADCRAAASRSSAPASDGALAVFVVTAEPNAAASPPPAWTASCKAYLLGPEAELRVCMPPEPGDEAYLASGGP